MPVPVVLVGVGGAAVATAAYRRRRRVERKRVLVVGPRDAGKSTLHALLAGGERSLNGRALRGETVGFVTKKVAMKQRGWQVSYVDSPSAAEEIEAGTWADHLADADLGLFVVDGSRLADDRYRASAELLAITCRINAGDGTRWMLVVTHADVCPVDDVAGHEEIRRILDDPHPQFVDLRDWAMVRPVVRRVVTELK